MKANEKPNMNFIFYEYKIPPSKSHKDYFFYPTQATYIKGDDLYTKSPQGKKLGGKPAWDLFYKHATFNDILTASDKLFNNVIFPAIKKPQEPTFDTFLNSNLKSQLLADAIDADVIDVIDLAEKIRMRKQLAAVIAPEFHTYYRQMLEVIRERPSVLTAVTTPNVNEYAKVLSEILGIARWSTDKETAKRAKYLLLDHLIPQKKGGAKRGTFSPSLFDMMKTLTVNLSQHLSTQCKNQLAGYDKREICSEWEAYHYKELMNWANTYENRVSTLSSNDLKTLVYSPSKFATNLVSKHFNVTLKTAKKALQQTP